MRDLRGKELATRIIREWYEVHKRSDLPALRDQIEVYLCQLISEIDAALARVAVLEGALERYGRGSFEAGCTAVHESAPQEIRQKENKCGLCLPHKPCNFATCPNDQEDPTHGR